MAQLPYNYVQDGLHTIYIENRFTIKTKINATSGLPIIIDTSLLLENSCNIMYIIQPDGTRYNVTIDNVDYECFEFNIKIAVEV